MEQDALSNTESRHSLRPDLQPIAERPMGDVREDLAALWRKWFGDKAPGQSSWAGAPSLGEALSIYGIDMTAAIDTVKINNKVKEFTVEIANVMATLNRGGLLGDHQTSFMVRMILAKLEATQALFIAAYKLYNAETRQPADLAPDNFAYFRFVPENPDTEPNPGQRARIFALNDLMHRGFRRYRDCVVKRITTPEGLPTCAWEKVVTISDYCKSLTGRRFLEPKLWMWLTNGAGYQPVKQLTEYLENCDDPEVPFIEPDRHVFSFRNGAYMAKDEVFVPYADAHRYFPRDGYPTACKHFDMDFVPGDLMPDDPMEIPTPGIETIFDTQKFSPILRRWCYCFFGRLMYDVGEMDDWQILPFCKGLANTGKSMLLNYARELYEDHDVGTISNIIEKQFGLSQVAGKFIGIGDDLRKNFQLDQTEFQNAVSGNGVSCAQKFKGTRIEKPWTTPMFWSGNEVPGFHDNSGSYGRRMAVFLFAFMVVQADGGLFDKMMADFPRFIVKSNRIYRNILRRYGNAGIWEVLPAEFQQQRQELTACSNALVGFLGSNQVRRTVPGEPLEGLYISVEALRDAVLGYAIKNNLEKPQWGPDYFRGPLATAGLKIGADREKKKYPRHADRMIRGPFVYGMDLEINCEIAESNGQEVFAAVAAAAAAAAPGPLDGPLGQPQRKRARVGDYQGAQQ